MVCSANDALVSVVENQRNSSLYSGIQATPDEVYSDRKNNDEIIARNTAKTQGKQAKYRATEVQVGDRVFVSTRGDIQPRPFQSESGKTEGFILPAVEREFANEEI